VRDVTIALQEESLVAWHWERVMVSLVAHTRVLLNIPGIARQTISHTLIAQAEVISW